MLFTERSAAEFISGDTEGGRSPDRRHLSADCVQSQQPKVGLAFRYPNRARSFRPDAARHRYRVVVSTRRQPKMSAMPKSRLRYLCETEPNCGQELP